ncbi:MAG: RnfABCDGE type electron transport complex subunit D [Ignavibacteria bacterium]|nr:RnfABCDGE type electron transport complex subunit D [Ignavibacteria bacterium]
MEQQTVESLQEKRLKLGSSPHIKSPFTTEKAMYYVIIALIPCIISSVIFFGFYQLVVIGTCCVFSVATEYVIKKLRKQKITIMDGSAFLTGLLLGLILPPNYPLSHCALGSIFAIGIGKEIFGGLGFNIFNPALVGRAFLQASFPVETTTWVKPKLAVDTVTSATPLAQFKFEKVIADVSHLFFGNVSGSLGETSALAILIGGLFLIIIRVANWEIPLSMIIGMVCFQGILWVIDPTKYANPLFHILSGGFLFGAFFMATDWVTSPITKKGMWLYGIAISLLIVVIRNFGGLPEGVMYAILLMNAATPLINRYTIPKIFGEAK